MIKFLVLIALLGSSSFQTREAVDRAIEPHISLLIPLPNISNHEIRGRLQRMDLDYKAKNAEKIVASLGRLPFIDAHPDIDVQFHYRNITDPKIDNSSPLFLKDKEATRLMFIDIIKHKEGYQDILEVMREREHRVFQYLLNGETNYYIEIMGKTTLR